MKTGDMHDLELADEDGIIGLVDASAYKSFVSEDWTYEQLLDHFNTQMAAHAILVWECGDGGNLYRIKVRGGFSEVNGWRNTMGSIIVSNNQLHFSSYTALTMAAQFDDNVIPASEEKGIKIALENGSYKIRIIQNYNPAMVNYDTFSEPHFVIEIEEGLLPAWTDTAWETNRRPSSDVISTPPIKKGFFQKLFGK